METQNEIKAKEIAENNMRGHRWLTKKSSYEECYNSALIAMEWKDKQAKEQRRIIRNHWQNWATEQIKKTLLTIYPLKGMKYIKGYVNEKYKSITGKSIKLPKCIKVEEYHESAQMKLKDAQFEQQREKLINDILGVIKKELGEHIGKGLGLYHGELLNLDASLVVIEEGIKKIKQQL